MGSGMTTLNIEKAYESRLVRQRQSLLSGNFKVSLNKEWTLPLFLSNQLRTVGLAYLL